MIPARLKGSSRFRVCLKSSLDHLPFLSVAFRPFFLSAALFSIVAVVVWIAYLNSVFEPAFIDLINPTVWHLHEMIFGFAGACAVGFLLTAVQTWTGLRSLHGSSLLAVFLVWIAARIALWQGAILYGLLLTSLFWIVVICLLYRLLTCGVSKRNYIFIPILTVLLVLNSSVLLAEYFDRSDLALHFGRTAVLLFGILVSLVGGRIIPLFTRNATRSVAIKHSNLMDFTLLIVSAAGALVFFSYEFVSLPFKPAWLMFLAGVLHLFRLSRWDSKSTLNHPLLWSLHLSYLYLGVGLILLGTSYFSVQISFADALHVIAIGTLGSMILSVIVRVSLGHAGRLLQTTPLVNFAFISILTASASRFLIASVGFHQYAWFVSGMLWVIAFSIFVYQFSRMLFEPRVN